MQESIDKSVVPSYWAAEEDKEGPLGSFLIRHGGGEKVALDNKFLLESEKKFNLETVVYQLVMGETLVLIPQEGVWR